MEKELREPFLAAVREAGRLMVRMREEAHVYEKADWGDVVTDADLAVQDMLKRELSSLLPGSGFLGEEKGETADPFRGDCFIVDPIDGTVNFTRDMGQSAVSVALYRNGLPEAGCVYDPFREKTYFAERGRGAFCNGAPIRVSDRPPERASLQMGYSPQLGQESVRRLLALQEKLLARFMNIRNYGVASIELCNVAAGRQEAYLSFSLQPWDHAAAGIILREAGGEITRLDGSPLRLNGPETVLACPDGLREALLEITREARIPEPA